MILMDAGHLSNGQAGLGSDLVGCGADRPDRGGFDYAAGGAQPRRGAGFARRGSSNEVIRGSLPFVIAMLGLIALLMAAADIALWLPLFHGIGALALRRRALPAASAPAALLGFKFRAEAGAAGAASSHPVVLAAAAAAGVPTRRATGCPAPPRLRGLSGARPVTAQPSAVPILAWAATVDAMGGIKGRSQPLGQPTRGRARQMSASAVRLPAGPITKAVSGAIAQARSLCPT